MLDNAVRRYNVSPMLDLMLTSPTLAQPLCNCFRADVRTSATKEGACNCSFIAVVYDQHALNDLCEVTHRCQYLCPDCFMHTSLALAVPLFED